MKNIYKFSNMFFTILILLIILLFFKQINYKKLTYLIKNREFN